MANKLIFSDVDSGILKRFLSKSTQVTGSVLNFKFFDDHIESTATNADDSFMKHWKLPFADFLNVGNVKTEGDVKFPFKASIVDGKMFIGSILPYFSDKMTLEVVLNDANQAYSFILYSKDLNIAFRASNTKIAFAKDVSVKVLEDSFSYAQDEPSFTITPDVLKKIMNLCKLDLNPDSRTECIEFYTSNGNLKLKSGSFDYVVAENVTFNLPESYKIDHTLLPALCSETYKVVIAEDHYEGAESGAKKFVFISIESDTRAVILPLETIDADIKFDDFNDDLSFERKS